MKAVACFLNGSNSLGSWERGEEVVRNAGALQINSNSPSLLKGARQSLAFLCSSDGQQLEETPPI